MSLYHKTSIIRAQAIRLFNLIQQTTQKPIELLHRQSLKRFIQNLGLNPSTDLVLTLHTLDKQGKQFNQQYWGQCISTALVDSKIHTQKDITKRLHNDIISLLLGEYCRPILKLEQWDENKDLNLDEKNDKYQKIKQLKKQLPVYIDVQTLGSYISSINFCLSIVTLDPGMNYEIKKQAILIYQQILQGNYMQILKNCLVINIESDQFLIEIMKNICYLYTAARYDIINKLLARTFLFDITIIKGLLERLDDQRVQIRYYTFIIACLTTYHVHDFSDWVVRDSQCLYYLFNSIGRLTDNDGLLFGIEILINLLNAYEKQQRQWRVQNQTITKSIYTFGINVLHNQNIKSLDTQAACLRLFAMYVRVGQPTESQLKSLSIINDIFQDRGDDQKNESIMQIVSAALDVISNVLIYVDTDFKLEIINNKNFEVYLKNSLERGHKQWYQHANILQISLLLSLPQHAKYLFEKNLLITLFELSQHQNGCIKFYISEILLNLINISLTSQWMISQLHQNKILNCIGLLIKQSFNNDNILTYYYSQRKDSYYSNKNVFVNCLKALYLLTDSNNKNKQEDKISYMRKCDLYRKNFTEYFIDNFISALDIYFKSADSRNIMAFNLSQKHQIYINSMEKIKMFKLISYVIEQMTIYLRKKTVSTQLLRKIHRMRNQFLDNIYSHLSLQELEAENIPIYIKLNLQIQGKQAEILRVYRLSYTHLLYYIAETIKKITGIPTQQFRIRERNEGMEIKSQYEYRKILDKILSDNQRSQFYLQLVAFDILEKNLEVRDFGSKSLNMGGSPGSRRGNMGESGRFMSMRMPQHRDASPYASQKIYTGNNSYRSNSPNFGSQCMKCRTITTNKSRLCSGCINQQNNFR